MMIAFCEGALDKEADHAFDLLSVDSHGKTLPQRALIVQLYELEWSWWWDERQQNYAQYISNNMHALKETAIPPASICRMVLIVACWSALKMAAAY